MNGEKGGYMNYIDFLPCDNFFLGKQNHSRK